MSPCRRAITILRAFFCRCYHRPTTTKTALRRGQNMKDKRKTYLVRYLINPQGKYVPVYSVVPPAEPVQQLDENGVPVPEEASSLPGSRKKTTEEHLVNSLARVSGKSPEELGLIADERSCDGSVVPADEEEESGVEVAEAREGLIHDEEGDK